MSFEMDRKTYSQMFGPTTGDSVRLGDTNLFAKVEKDYTVYGQESKFAGGKVLRDGMGQSATALRKSDPKVVDFVITNALIIDYTGIYKADIGIRDGKIIGIGKSGNPDNMDNVDFVIGASTEAMNADGMIVTAGGIDTHVHYISPELADMGLFSCHKNKHASIVSKTPKFNLRAWIGSPYTREQCQAQKSLNWIF